LADGEDNEGSFRDCYLIPLFEPLQAIRPDIVNSGQTKLTDHLNRGYICTASSIDDEVSSFVSYLASRVKDLLPLTSFWWDFSGMNYPLDHKHFTFLKW